MEGMIPWAAGYGFEDDLQEEQYMLPGEEFVGKGTLDFDPSISMGVPAWMLPNVPVGHPKAPPNSAATQGQDPEAEVRRILEIANPKPTKRQRVTGMVGDLVRGAVDAGAVQNVAGGGGTDVWRAMQAAGQGYDQRKLLQDKRQEAKQKLVIDAIKAQSEKEKDEALAHYHEQQIKASQAKSQREADAAAQVAGRPYFEAGGKVYDRKTGKLLETPKQATSYRPADEEERLIKARSDARIREANAKPEKPTGPWRPTNQKEAYEFEEYKAKMRRQYRTAREDKPKDFTVQHRIVEAEKHKQFAKARKDLEEDLANNHDSLMGLDGKEKTDSGAQQKRGSIYRRYNQQMQAAQDAYEDELRALGDEIQSQPVKDYYPPNSGRPAAAPAGGGSLADVIRKKLDNK